MTRAFVVFVVLQEDVFENEEHSQNVQQRCNLIFLACK